MDIEIIEGHPPFRDFGKKVRLQKLVLLNIGTKPVIKDPDSLKQRADETERDAKNGEIVRISGDSDQLRCQPAQPKHYYLLPGPRVEFKLACNVRYAEKPDKHLDWSEKEETRQLFRT